jgi:putative DNA primase/helicase
MVEDKQQQSDAKRKKPIAGAIARRLMDKFHFATIHGSKNEDVLIYTDSGTYRYGGEALIKEQVQTICKDDANTHFVGEVLGHIRRSSYISLDVIDEGDNILNVSNGLVNMASCELQAHTPMYHSFIQLPVKFDRNAKCPKIEAFIASIFSRQDAEIVKEFIGFLLIKPYMFHKSLMVTGESHTGKTTFVNLVAALIGHKNISSITLQDLCDKPFSIAELHGKLANISDDLPSNPVRYAGQFKRLTGESIITAERKFRDPFIFTNKAKAIFTCNELPPVQGGDDAYYYRWIIVQTSNKFNKEDCNRNMLREITTPQELSGFLNLALRYRAKLLKQNQFTESLSIDQSRQRYNLTVKDSVSRFIAERTVKEPDNWTAKDILYETYAEWCADNDIPAKANNAFHRRFQSLLDGNISVCRPMYLGQQIWAYKGVSLIENS